MPKLANIPIRRTIWDEVLLDCAARGVVVPEGPVIYFIEAIGTGQVKIGKARILENRWVQLRNASTNELRLLKALPGYTDEEHWAHEHFDEYRIKSEWFELEPIRDRIEALTNLGSLNLRAKYWGQDELVTVTAACGCEKKTSRAHAKHAQTTACPRCGQLQRFAQMNLDERRAEIAGARAGWESRVEQQKGMIAPSTVERLMKHACIKCGKPVYGSASLSQSAINNGKVRKYCANCHGYINEVGNVYGELSVIRISDKDDYRGGKVYELRCIQGHITTRSGTQLRHLLKNGRCIQCPECPHVWSPSKQNHVLDVRNKQLMFPYWQYQTGRREQ